MSKQTEILWGEAVKTDSVSEDWLECKLGEIINLKRGYDLPKDSRIPGIVPIISSSGITDYHANAMVKGPGVVTGRYGTIGQVFYSEVDYWPLNTALYVQDFKGNDRRFIYYFLTGLDFNQFSDKSAVPGINRNHVHEADVSLPPLPEQRAIAAVLSSLDDKIDLLHRQNATLEALAETLFRQWFLEEAEEASDKYLLLGELVDSVSITHKFQKREVVFLNTSDVEKGRVVNSTYSPVKDLPGQAKKSIQNGDILFSEIRPANGRWAYIDFNAEDYVVSTKLMVLRSKGIIDQSFVYFYLTNAKTVEWLQIVAESRSGTFPQITFDQLRNLKVNISSKANLEEVTEWCKTSLFKISRNNSQIQTLSTLRDTLLPKLMSGEVRVAY